MLDRIIGFRLSKLLQSKLQNAPSNASAGRVQSIALKLVIDREREILAFVPTKYW
ncbi:DNA topoisomerase 1, partial [Mycoplasmopsis synoviae]